MRISVFLATTGLILAAGCTSSGPTTTTAAPTTTTTAAPTTTTAPATTTTAAPPAADPCAGVDFRNRTYNLPDSGLVTVTGGQGQRGAPGGADYAALQIRGVATGDIGGASNVPETLVFTNVNTGGTGQFTDVHVFTCSGATVTRITSAGSGDRADGGVRSMSVSAGRVIIDRNSDASAGACCPTQATRQGFVLAGAALTPAGPAALRKIIGLDRPAGSSEAAITFLPGTSGAILIGDTATANVGGFDAAGGQHVMVRVDAVPAGTSPVVIDLRQGAAVLGTATSATSLNATLPANGHYQLVARTSPAGAPVNGFDAELTIT